MTTTRTRTILACVLITSGLTMWTTQGSASAASTPINGAGSSFAGIELEQWTTDVIRSPYFLQVNYTSSSSGAGRSQFKDGVIDYAVSDIRYNKFDGSPPPAGTYIYVPITAGGIAIMYNLKTHGFGETSAPIRLTSFTICAMFTGGIRYWDDANIKRDNPGRTLPHVLITPVMRSDPAGTNFVMEEYCIATQRAMYFAFADAASRASGQDYPREPTSSWPLVKPIVGAEGSEGVANVVAGVGNDGYVTAVETGYASQRHFPVAAVKNGSSNFVLPTEPNVGAALSYARQLDDGTHVLNFSPPAANAYNPSTYSYLIAHTTGFDPGKGHTLTAFANYCLTIGQKEAGRLRYASIGRNLILQGLNVIKKIPGYVAPSATELAAVPAIDAFNTHVNAARGKITTPRASTGGSTSVAAVSLNSAPAGRSNAPSAGVDPSAQLGPVGALGHTGAGEQALLALGGGCLVLLGEISRRRALRKRRT